ncbi:putative oxidoreductase YxbG [Grifola frondosa]|uniref:Putative oxidoreductase YxbG n=1 Tax=Grifola frondosa TaxID=5627 RepID=A0A1C7MHF7_GRIFR|nr:putative oxidoreductase YxbG [Grifola frondosa]
MPGRIQHKAALITGAGSGIGLESALLFAQEGANVLLVDINLAAAEKTLALVRQRAPGVQAAAIRADVGKEADVKAAVDKAVELFGRLDIMFNNAGIMHPADDNALNTEERIWDLTMQVNVKGVWWGCKYAILVMRANRADPARGLHTGGSIINTASFVALMGAATPQLAYTASKGAVLSMTRELAMVHAREGIRFNSICPYAPPRPFPRYALTLPDQRPPQDTPADGLPRTQEKRDRRMVHLPMGRFGEAVEVARGALFLASDDSSYMTGTDFKVDGGLSSCYVTPLGEQVLPPPVSLAAQ